MIRKFLLFVLLIASLNANAEENKISLTLISVIKPELRGFSTSGLGGLVGAATIPYVGQIIGDITEAGLSKEKYSEDFNSTIQSKDVTNIIVNQIKEAIVASNKYNVEAESYTEEGDMKYQVWLERKDRLSKNQNDYICEIGIRRVNLEDQFFTRLIRAEFAIKIIKKNDVINTQATSFGDFLMRWERVEGIEDKNNAENVKKAYTETLNKISGKLAKDLAEKL
jgi:hypothetical protein